MIDMKLNNDVSLAKNNNNSLAGWAGHCAAILSLLIIRAGLVISYVQQCYIIIVNCFIQCYWFQQIIPENMDA